MWLMVPPLYASCVGREQVNASLLVPTDTFLAAGSRLLMQPSSPQH
jgi:hypothetical protein